MKNFTIKLAFLSFTLSLAPALIWACPNSAKSSATSTPSAQNYTPRGMRSASVPTPQTVAQTKTPRAAKR